MTETMHTIDRREFSRVYAYIPLGYRLLQEEEQRMVRARICGDAVQTEFRVTPELEDVQHAEWFKILNAKLDTILRMLATQNEGFQSLPYKAVRISGNGIDFSTAETFQVGDMLEMKMILSGTPGIPLYMFTYGEVVKSDRQSSGGAVVALRFVRMDDKIRDEIVRFVFEKEREILREKRK